MNRERITIKLPDGVFTGMDFPNFLNLTLDDGALTIPRWGLWVPGTDTEETAYVRAGARIVLRGNVSDKSLLPIKWVNREH
jgi:hypothetical protein